MLLLSIVVFAVTVLVLGSFLGKMLLYVICIFAFYMAGTIRLIRHCPGVLKRVAQAPWRHRHDWFLLA